MNAAAPIIENDKLSHPLIFRGGEFCLTALFPPNKFHLDFVRWSNIDDRVQKEIIFLRIHNNGILNMRHCVWFCTQQCLCMCLCCCMHSMLLSLLHTIVSGNVLLSLGSASKCMLNLLVQKNVTINHYQER